MCPKRFQVLFKKPKDRFISTPFIVHRTAPGFHGWRLRVRRVNAGQGSQQHLSRTAGEGLEAVATEWA